MASSAGYNDSIISSASVMSRAVPNVASVEKNDSSSPAGLRRTSGTNHAASGRWGRPVDVRVGAQLGARANRSGSAVRAICRCKLFEDVVDPLPRFTIFAPGRSGATSGAWR